jgi:signal transduction histidine kinase
LGSSQRKFLTRIKANAERMRQMADDLFHEGQGDAEEATSRQQSVELATLIEETVAQARCQMEDRELTLDLVLAKDLPVIHAEPGVLQRVLSNLLSNACLASTVGGRVQVEATLATAAPQALDMDLNDGEYVIVSVSDSGSGLSGEELERVFDRSRPSQTPPGVGESGASLALVKMMIEARGGKIWVQSREGKGTTFGFAVPVLSEEPPLEPTPGEGAA